MGSNFKNKVFIFNHLYIYKRSKNERKLENFLAKIVHHILNENEDNNNDLEIDETNNNSEI